MTCLVAHNAGITIDVELLKFSDHGNFETGVCCEREEQTPQWLGKKGHCRGSDPVWCWRGVDKEDGTSLVTVSGCATKPLEQVDEDGVPYFLLEGCDVNESNHHLL